MADKPIRVAVTGANGRMGRELIRAINQTSSAILAAALVPSGSTLLGVDAGELIGIGACGVLLTDELHEAVEDFDVLIDFTQPAATLRYLAFCCQHGKPMIIGTTGFTQAEQQTIQKSAEQIGIVFAANFSVGVNLMLKLLEKTAMLLGRSSDIEIVEAHHRHKVDAPSGTALAMGKVIADTLGWDLQQCAVYGRKGYIGERDQQSIGFATLRAGDIVGEHTALFASQGERLEISHKASSRENFALGALRAAHWIVHQPVGLYDMRDVLSLHQL